MLGEYQGPVLSKETSRVPRGILTEAFFQSLKIWILSTCSTLFTLWSRSASLLPPSPIFAVVHHGLLCDLLDALGECKCDFGMSAIVNIKTLKGRLIAHKFNTGWAVGAVKSAEKKKSVAGQFAVSIGRWVR